VYTAADQTTDFGGPQGALGVAIYQLSAAVGRGRGEMILAQQINPDTNTTPVFRSRAVAELTAKIHDPVVDRRGIRTP
jgi:hypothetical protein